MDFYNIYRDYIASQLNQKPNTDLSNKCILQCVFCQRQLVHQGEPAGREKVKLSQDMPLEDFKKVINTFKGMNMCGQLSDPIYHPQFLNYLQIASDLNKHCNIHTNGSGKKKSFWKQAFAIPKPMFWIFGIDGLDQKTCNLHRIGQNFHQSFKAMLLGSKSHHKIIWQFIPFQHNEHQIDRAISIARKHNIQFLLLKSNRWRDNPIYVDNQLVIPDWIRPPKDESLSEIGMHVKRELYVKGTHTGDMKP